VSAADCAMLEALRFAQHQTAATVRASVPASLIATLWARATE
jgi:hypothetical protein